MTAEALLQKGHLLACQGQLDEAVDLILQSIAARPDFPQGYLYLGNALYVAGLIEQARHFLDMGLDRIPGSPSLHWARCTSCLPMVYADQAEMDIARAAFTNRLHALRSVCFASPESLSESVDAVGFMSPFFLAYQGRNDRALLEVHGRLAADVMAANFPRYTVRPRRTVAAGEPIRVGIVSGLFWRHSVWRMPTRGWVEHLDRSRFQVFGYHTRPEQDDQTEYARQSCDRFVQAEMPVRLWAEKIMDDAPHVLIYPDLAIDQRSIQLASLRLAQVQCTSWGQPITSGLPTIDHYLSSEQMEPIDGEEHYSENLVRLPVLGVVYRRDTATWGDVLPPDDIWADVEMPADAVRIVCCQSQPKYLPIFDDVFPRIAMGLPSARFLFVATRPRGTDILSRRLHAAFARYGMSADAFCRFTDVLPVTRFSAMIRDAHIFLDTPVWSGCNTTLDALGHRVPIVTMPGPLMRGRHGLAILTIAGVTNTIAHSLDEYVALTIRLGRDLAWRAEISARLAAGRARVLDDATPVRALEAFLIDAVGRTGRDGQ